MISRINRIFNKVEPVPDRHVSLLISKNKIVSVGLNQRRKTHPMAAKFGYRFYSIHSELDALIRCGFERNLDILNLRFLKNGTLAMAKPCDKCLNMLRFFDVRNIYYSDDDRSIHTFKGPYHGQ